MPSTTPIACVGPKRVVWALQVSFFFVVFFCIVFFTPNRLRTPPATHTCHLPHPCGTHSVRRAQTTRLGSTGQFFYFFYFLYCFFDTHRLRTPPATHTCHLPHPYGTHSVRRAQTTRLGTTGQFFYFILFFILFFRHPQTTYTTRNTHMPSTTPMRHPQRA